MKTHGCVPTVSSLPLIMTVASAISLLFPAVAVAEATSSLTLLYPNGREILLSGETHSVTWQSTPDVNDVLIEYSLDNGGLWIPVDPPNQQNSGSYNWLIPLAHSDLCLLRISDADDPDISDTCDYLFAIHTVGALAAWGRDDEGQTDVPWGDEFVSISGGGFHCLAVRLDGTIAAWGENVVHQSEIPPGNNYTAVAAGYKHSLALKKDGSLFGWGRNIEGQTIVPTGNDFVAIAAGGYHSLAIKEDGSLAGWGKDTSDQATVPPGNDYSAVAAGWSHSIALQSDGAVVGWGFNGSGQIDIPPDANDIIAISAGNHHNLALKANGYLIAWGMDNENQVSDTPLGNDFIAIAAGGYHNLALKSDGTVLCWGRNAYGQIEPQSQQDFTSLAAGGEHSIALRLIGLSLIDPNGHEVFQATDSTTVRWRSRGLIDQVTIEYSTNDEQDCTPVINSDNTGSYEWTIPAVTSDLCRICLSNDLETNIGDSSDDAFTIFVCTLNTDLNGDCVNNLEDLAILCEQWLASDAANPCPLTAELAGNDCLVNLEDFNVYIWQWLQCGNPFDPECTP